jgi:hypothetical protein
MRPGAPSCSPFPTGRPWPPRPNTTSVRAVRSPSSTGARSSPPMLLPAQPASRWATISEPWDTGARRPMSWSGTKTWTTDASAPGSEPSKTSSPASPCSVRGRWRSRSTRSGTATRMNPARSKPWSLRSSTRPGGNSSPASPTPSSPRSSPPGRHAGSNPGRPWTSSPRSRSPPWNTPAPRRPGSSRSSCSWGCAPSATSPGSRPRM